MSQDEGNDETGLQLGQSSFEKVVKLIYNPRYKEAYDADKEKVEKANKHLEREYISIGLDSVKTAFVALILIYALDHLFYVHPVVYGASLNALGALFMVYPRFSGRYKIAGLADGNEEIQMIAGAENTVYTNIGFGYLLLGFLTQIFVLQLTAGEQLVTVNYLTSVLPWWAEAMSIFVVFIICLPLGFTKWRWWFGLS